MRYLVALTDSTVQVYIARTISEAGGSILLSELVTKMYARFKHVPVFITDEKAVLGYKDPGWGMYGIVNGVVFPEGLLTEPDKLH